MRTTLPAKWAIARNTTNFKSLNTWANSMEVGKYPHYSDNNYIIYPKIRHPNGVDNFVRPSIPTGYEFITDEEFNTLVLTDTTLKVLSLVEKKEIRKEKLELKGKYRERVKELEDEIVKLKRENSKLWDELAKK